MAKGSSDTKKVAAIFGKPPAKPKDPTLCSGCRRQDCRCPSARY